MARMFSPWRGRRSSSSSAPPTRSALRVAVVAVVFAISAASAPCAAEPSAPPSFVLVTLDTTRADRLGAYGRGDAHTPSLDELARRGAMFERAYAATPVTLPSHATIFTGEHPPTHGVRDNGLHALPDEATTLAEVLRSRGYRTAAFVSAAVLARRYGLAQGFEVYDDDLEGGRPRQLRMVAERTADVTVGAAGRWLDDLTGDAPLFLWVHLFDPHAPYAPPPSFATRLPGRPYDGEIAFADAEVGRLLAHPRLARAAAAGALLVMAIADHGEGLGEHGEASHGMLAYEATLRVPWIVAGPGVRAGLRVAEPVSQADLLPTALALLDPGRAPSLAGDGESQGDRLRGVPAPGGRRAVYAETLVPYFAYGWSPLRAWIEGSWKLIEAPAPELYDVAADPAEARNLHAVERDRAALLTRDLATRFGSPDAAPREARVAPDPSSDAKLRSLGYLGGRGAAVPARARRDPKTMMDVHRSIERAEAHLYARDFAEAVRELRSALERDPDNLAALEDMAVALAEQGRFDGAEGALDRALALAPESAALHLSRAQLEGARGRWESALAGADAALALAPHDVGALALRAEALDRLGRRAEAAAGLERALAVAPAEPLLEVRYAEIVELPAGRVDAAEARLVRATARQPHLAAAWRALGQVREAARRPADARDAYGEGLRFQPRDPTLHTALGLLLADSDPALARRHLGQAIELSPAPSLAVLNALGDLLAVDGDAAGAARAWGRVVERPAPTADDRHQRAAALRSLGRPQEAAAAWRELVAVTPGHAPAWQGLSAIALDGKDWSEAAAAARRAVELDPELATAWNILAVATEKREGKAAAVPLYRRAVEADPGYWQASFNLGLVLLDLERFSEAAVALEAVLRESPHHAKVHYEIGLLYAGPLDDAARARRHLETALALDAAHSRAPAARQALSRLPAG